MLYGKLSFFSKLQIYVFVLAIMMFVPMSVGFAQTAPMDTAVALIEAEAANDVDAVVALFSDDAVVTLPTGVLDTPEAIRGWQQEIADGNFAIEAVNIQEDGSTVTWTGNVSLDRFRALGIPSLNSTWSLVIEDGLIQTFDFNFTPEAFGELTAGATVAGVLAAEAAHDVDAAVALFAEDAVVTLPTGVLDTPEAIRGWQEELAAGNFHLEPVSRYVDGNTVYLRGEIALQLFRDMGIPSLESEWVIVVNDGMISTFDFVFTPEAMESLQAAAPA